MILIIIAIIIALFLLIVLYAHFCKAKCPNCKKRNATGISKTVSRTEDIYFKEKETIKEYKNVGNFRTDFGMRGATNQYYNPPEKIITREVAIPGKRIWYNAQYKCNHCGQIFSRQEYEDRKPQIKK